MLGTVWRRRVTALVRTTRTLTGLTLVSWLSRLTVMVVWETRRERNPDIVRKRLTFALVGESSSVRTVRGVSSLAMRKYGGTHSGELTKSFGVGHEHLSSKQ